MTGLHWHTLPPNSFALPVHHVKPPETLLKLTELWSEMGFDLVERAAIVVV